MGNYKIDNYFNEQFGTLWKESREQRAFDLGYARGIFELYRYLIENNDLEDPDKAFEPMAKSNRHFQKYVELYKEEDSESERLAYKYQKCKGFKEQMDNKLREEKLQMIESLNKEFELFKKIIMKRLMHLEMK